MTESVFVLKDLPHTRFSGSGTSSSCASCRPLRSVNRSADGTRPRPSLIDEPLLGFHVVGNQLEGLLQRRALPVPSAR